MLYAAKPFLQFSALTLAYCEECLTQVAGRGWDHVAIVYVRA